MSNISNPFGAAEERGSSEKSLSKRGSFVNARNTERMSANNMELEDPFENNGHGEMNNSNSKSPRPKDNSDMPPKDTLDSKEKSFQGFNFSAFMDASMQKSEGGVSKQKEENKNNQSGLNFSDFGNIADNRESFPGFDQKQNLSVVSKNNESFDFFNQKANDAPRDSFFNSSKSDKEDGTKRVNK